MRDQVARVINSKCIINRSICSSFRDNTYAYVAYVTGKPSTASTSILAHTFGGTRHTTLHVRTHHVALISTIYLRDQPKVERVFGDVNHLRICTGLVEFTRSERRTHVSDDALRYDSLDGLYSEVDAGHRVRALARGVLLVDASEIEDEAANEAVCDAGISSVSEFRCDNMVNSRIADYNEICGTDVDARIGYDIKHKGCRVE